MRLVWVAMLCGGAALAQWIHLPTPNVPKGKDGKPNLSAPAPRVGGKPDLSGLWLPGEPLPCPPILKDEVGGCLEKTALSKFAANLNAVVPGGLPFQPWAVEVMKERAKSGIDPHVACLPSSFPRLFTLPHVSKFLQMPGLLAILNEYNASYRQIFTDGRAFPVDPQPAWNGYSVGRWEGDTLVVKTIGFRDDLWMDMVGTPLTSQATVTEKFRRPNFGRLEIEATVDDAKAYTKPWTMTIVENFALDTELIDEVCAENEQSSKHLK